MRSIVLAGLLATFATPSSIALACGGAYSTQPMFQHAVFTKSHMIAVDRNGHLVSNDLMWGTKRDYGTLDKKLQSNVAMGEDKVCVLTADEVCEVSLASGKILRSAKQSVGSGAIGYIDADHVYISDGVSVELLDLETAKAVAKINLVTDDEKKLMAKFDSTVNASAVRHNNLLYVGHPQRRGVSVVDLKEKKVIKQLEGLDRWVSGLHLCGDQLLIREWGVSYGFVSESLTSLNLETGKSLRIQPPKQSDGLPPRYDSAAKQTFELVGCGGGGFLMAFQDGIYQYSADGKLVGSSAQALKNGEILLGESKGRALLSNSEGFGFTRMKRTKLAAE
jgi:hypothetical protein